MRVDFVQYPSVEDAQKQYEREIDDKALEVRGRFADIRPIQASVYQEKAREAEEYLNAPTRPPAEYPYLFAENARTRETMNSIAERVMQRRRSWRDDVDPRIEAERVAGKAEVRAAFTVREAFDAKEAVLAALDSIRATGAPA